MQKTSCILFVLGFFHFYAYGADQQWERGRQGILSRAGCFLVDYSYVETEALKPGYVLDTRVYDVNKGRSVKEWIYADELSPQRIRLQHILFATDLSGQMLVGSMLKHHAEDWEYNAASLYDFTGPATWAVKDLSAGLWTRRITNLDDGLRYQCAAAWSLATAYPEWSCENYSPIPGRETRDMKRSDYNTLLRTTRIIAYGDSWLERQNNTKTIDQGGTRIPLAREFGKDWYVRLPDADCADAKSFTQARQAFWTLLRETWDSVLTGDRPFVEKSIAGQAPRYMKMMDLEEQYVSQDLASPAIRQSAQVEILRLISEYRNN